FPPRPAQTDCSVDSDPELSSQFILRNPVDKGLQAGVLTISSDINTERAVKVDQGVNHVEGGWPKDVNPMEIDQTGRFRKKVEKEEGFMHAIRNLSELMVHAIKQNNAIDIYSTYFCEETEGLEDELTTNIVQVYRDPSSPKRNVCRLSWAPDGQRLAGAYSIPIFLGQPEGMSHDSYIWAIVVHLESRTSGESYIPSRESYIWRVVHLEKRTSGESYIWAS
ncbi:unnamed protein product, partial [Cyprideis torosa]